MTRRIREWDCVNAPEAELASWVRAYNRALAVDLPDDPPWGALRLRDYLTATMPGERRVMWLAEAGKDEVAGFGRLLMQTGMGVVEIFVAPAYRRQGVGRRLLATIADRAVAEGFTMLGLEVAGGTAAVAYYQSLGFANAYTEMRSVLDLTTVDWSAVRQLADGVVHGYEVRCYHGDLPDELLPSYAEVKQVRQLDPIGDLELRPSSYDPQRLRDSIDTLQARAMVPYFVVAIHERSERIVALTEVVVALQHPTRADQYDTVIVAAHDGYGLARAIKARMLLELRAAEPRLLEVQTWEGKENLEHVNFELGFQPDREWLEYQIDARSLVERLATVASQG